MRTRPVAPPILLFPSALLLEILLLLILLVGATSGVAGERSFRISGGVAPVTSHEIYAEGVKTGAGAAIGLGQRLGSVFELGVGMAYHRFERDDEGLLLAMGLTNLGTGRVDSIDGGTLTMLNLGLDLRFTLPEGDEPHAFTLYLLGSAGVVLRDYGQVNVFIVEGGHFSWANQPAESATELGLGAGAGFANRFGGWSLFGEVRAQVAMGGEDRIVYWPVHVGIRLP